MSRLKVIALLAVVLLVAAGVVQGFASATRAQPARVPVVATFSVLGDLVQNVGGDRVEVITLVGPNGDVHAFEASPAESLALRNAALIVENGLELEPWLDDLYTAAQSSAPRVVVTDGLALIPATDDEHADEHEDEHEGEMVASHGSDADSHEHGEYDPHAWQDPVRVAVMVETIRDALSLADPAGSATYQANAEWYLAQLRELNAWAEQELSRVPAERRKLVTQHDAFHYFAQRYGFEVIGSALPVSTEAADPSIGEVAELVEKINTAGIPTIFAENSSNPQLTEQIAAAAGVRHATLYDVLGEPGGPAGTYLDMVRSNVATIAAGLGQ